MGNPRLSFLFYNFFFYVLFFLKIFFSSKMRWACILLAMLVASLNAFYYPKKKLPQMVPIKNGVVKSDEMRVLGNHVYNSSIQKPAMLKNGICSKTAGRPCCKAAAETFRRYVYGWDWLYGEKIWKTAEEKGSEHVQKL